MVFARRHTDAEALAWPASRLGEALELLARKNGLLPRPVEVPAPPEQVARAGDEQIGRWLQTAASQCGLEAEPVASSYADIDQFIRQAGPALLRLPGHSATGEPRFLALLKTGGWRLPVIAPDLSIRHVRPEIVRAALCAELEAPYQARAAQLLERASVPPQRRARARVALLRQWLGAAQIDGGWLIRLLPGSYTWGHIRHARLPQYAVALVSVYAIRQVLEIFAWWVLGRAALQGRFDWGWLAAWALLLLSSIPFQLVATWLQELFATGASAIFKQRMLYGTLQLEPEEIRHQGAGQFLGRVMETEAVELLALNGGFRVVIGLIGTLLAFWVLSLGAGGTLHALLFLCWTVFALLMGWRYYLHSYDWTEAHRSMTNDLVERMVGHRTRLAQEEPSRWHAEEDRALSRYLHLSQRLDRLAQQLYATIPRGWLFLGLAGIAASFVTASAAPASLAISLGGIILASQALDSLLGGMQSMINMLIAWKQIAPLYHAAARPKQHPVYPTASLAGTAPAAGTGQQQEEQPAAFLVADDLLFHYTGRPQPVIQGCSLHIRRGDRLLLEGPSGGGKSTFAALLTGLRRPDAGLLLLRGLDQQTIGSDEWRRRVVAAPQFHENHVMTETLAFNLLMGRRWPPTAEDLAEAEHICRELGLGDLLDRMPAGLQQMVGESGWQLSHGERSRLYIARALLQRADLIVLDESFAALDPENLQRALQCALRRAPALLVIAHP